MDIFVVIDRDHKPGEPELRAFTTHHKAHEFQVSIQPVQRRTMLYRIKLETDDAQPASNLLPF